MQIIKLASARIVVGYLLLLALTWGTGFVPWPITAATASAAEETEPKEKLTTVKGGFVSYKDGVLKVKAKEEQREQWKELEWKLADDVKVVSNIPNGPAKESAARDAFSLWEPGAPIMVKLSAGKIAFVEIGAKRAAERTTNKSPGDVQKDRTAWGKFISFKNNVLTIKLNSGALVETTIPENAQTLVWDQDENKYQPADTAAALRQAKAGTWFIVHVANGNAIVRVGARKGSTTGTFVSFKDDRLLMLGKDLGESYTKKYGNNVHFSKFRDDVLAYESIDGGEYKLIGPANEVLGDVKEGTILTIHAEGDDNITFVQIGVAKK